MLVKVQPTYTYRRKTYTYRCVIIMRHWIRTAIPLPLRVHFSVKFQFYVFHGTGEIKRKKWKTYEAVFIKIAD